MKLSILKGFGVMLMAGKLNVNLVRHGQYRTIRIFNIVWGKKTIIDYRFEVFDTKEQLIDHVKGITEEKLCRVIDVITRREVFYYYTGMDCDHSYWERPVKFDNIFKAEKGIEEAYEWAEGSESWSRITREDYDKYKNRGNVSRDLALEAHENGHPHSIRL